MSSSYSGNASGLTEASAVTITEPGSGDALAVASVNVALSKLADLVEFLRANTVKRSLGALVGGSIGQVGGPVPFDVSQRRQAFQYANPSLAVDDGTGHALAGAQACPVDTFTGAPNGSTYAGQFQPADAGEQDSRIYYMGNGDMLIARGCFWSDTTGINGEWMRSANHSGTAKVYQHGVGGLTIKSKAAGAAGDHWTDGTWDASMVLDPSTLTPKVVGVGSAPAYGTHFSAYSSLGAIPLQFYKDFFGMVHLYGSFQLDNPTNVGANAVFTLPAGYRYSGDQTAVSIAALYGANPPYGAVVLDGHANPTVGLRDGFWFNGDLNNVGITVVPTIVTVNMMWQAGA